MDGRRPPPEMSNFYCLPGRAGGTPMVLVNSFGSVASSIPLCVWNAADCSRHGLAGAGDNNRDHPGTVQTFGRDLRAAGPWSRYRAPTRFSDRREVPIISKASGSRRDEWLRPVRDGPRPGSVLCTADRYPHQSPSPTRAITLSADQRRPALFRNRKSRKSSSETAAGWTLRAAEGGHDIMLWDRRFLLSSSGRGYRSGCGLNLRVQVRSKAASCSAKMRSSADGGAGVPSANRARPDSVVRARRDGDKPSSASSFPACAAAARLTLSQGEIASTRVLGAVRTSPDFASSDSAARQRVTATQYRSISGSAVASNVRALAMASTVARHTAAAGSGSHEGGERSTIGESMIRKPYTIFFSDAPISRPHTRRPGPVSEPLLRVFGVFKRASANSFGVYLGSSCGMLCATSGSMSVSGLIG